MVQERTIIQREDAPLQVTADVKSQFKSIANWAFILSIISFILIGAVVVAALLSVFQMGFIRYASSASPLFVGVAYLIGCGLLTIPILSLFQFSQCLKKAIKEDDQNMMTSAFGQLKTGLIYGGLALFGLVAFSLAGSFLG